MKIYQLVFETKNKDYDYTSLYEYLYKLKAIMTTSHSCWIETDKSLEELCKDINKLICYNPPFSDFFCIMEISSNTDGMLPSSCWKWFKEKLNLN